MSLHRAYVADFLAVLRAQLRSDMIRVNVQCQKGEGKILWYGIMAASDHGGNFTQPSVRLSDMSAGVIL